MTRRLVLLRHGLTSWNAQRRFQGHADVELNEVGHLQAKAAAHMIARLAPVALRCSDLSRAVQTAAYVADAARLAPVRDERLREIGVGDLQGLTHDDVTERYGAGPWDYSRYGGESDAQVADRMLAAMTTALGSLPPEGTGVIVSHGVAIRLGLLRFLGWPAEQASSLRGLDNCGWVELEEATRSGQPEGTPGSGQPAGASGSAQPAARWRLAAYNMRAPIS